MDWLQGKQVSFTGRLASMTRAEARQLIRAHGGDVVPAVNRQTAFLVVGQECWPLRKNGELTGQLKKAQALQDDGHPIAILNEEDLLRRLELNYRTEGVHRVYSLAQLTEFLGVPRTRIRAWLDAGLIEPIEKAHGIYYFNFRQVVGAKTLCELTKAGISTERIRRSLEQLRAWLADADQPLDQLTLLEKNGQLLVRLEEGLVEPSGQMYFDFGEGQAILRTQPTSAAQWFQTGCRHEEDGFLDDAVHAYRQALLYGGPDAEVAFNLANVLYTLGRHQEASERYRHVVEIDPTYAEAWNNLGIVLGDMNCSADAVEAFGKAIDLKYADAHYNLADLLDSLGREFEARARWRAYLRCDVASPWSEYARSRLG